MLARAVGQAAGELAEDQRDRFADSGDDADERGRGAEGGQVGADDAAGAFLDGIAEAADQPEHEDEPLSADPVRAADHFRGRGLVHSSASPSPAEAAASPAAKLPRMLRDASSRSPVSARARVSQAQVDSVV